jgi:formate dehydrogenase major subunit
VTAVQPDDEGGPHPDAGDGYARRRWRKEVSVTRNYARLTRPLVRDNGELRPATMAEAIDRVADGLAGYRGDSFGLFSCSKGTNEMNYIAQKFSRVVMASNNIDSCNRT